MGRQVTVSFSDGTIITGFYSSAKSTEIYSLSPGDMVKVSPANPNKKKHRDRTGILTERRSKYGVFVNFDGGSYGSVDVCDLLPLTASNN
ncbi:hypothetical protein [Chamaesiphon polymorphus]|uniref:hypothetical protein n=1 Tax=Chamaesiphon polymorphus TaxID=2107691 RepID=UPI0011B234AB|nr:hypothetical protein [Chamaesiphon polymorphus]